MAVGEAPLMAVGEAPLMAMGEAPLMAVGEASEHLFIDSMQHCWLSLVHCETSTVGNVMYWGPFRGDWDSGLRRAG